MKEICKYIAVLALIVFSFYYADQISHLIIYRSDLMNEILLHKNNYEATSVDAIIIGSYIIPGINGQKVNEMNSYYNMKKNNKYSENKIIYDQIVPNLSVENNKDLIIKKGNSSKNAVSIIAGSNAGVIEYAKSNDINLSLLVTLDTLDKNSFFEQINNDINNYDDLEAILKRYEINTDICFRLSNPCNNKYRVEETFELDNKFLNYDVSSGDIILVDDNLTVNNFKLLLRKIKYRDLKIIYLSDLISEKRQI